MAGILDSSRFIYFLSQELNLSVKKIKSLLVNKSLGNIQYYDSVRINLGLFQSDVNVIGDLAIHDISILDYLIDEKPISVIANGVAHHTGQKENIAYVTLLYDEKFIANIHVNWLSPIKIRVFPLSSLKVVNIL